MVVEVIFERVIRVVDIPRTLNPVDLLDDGICSCQGSAPHCTTTVTEGRSAYPDAAASAAGSCCFFGDVCLVVRVCMASVGRGVGV